VVARLGISPSEAELRLARQDLAPVVEVEARRQLGPKFAGLWTDIDRDRIFVASVGQPLDVTAFERTDGVAGYVQAVDAAYTLDELQAAQAELVKMLGVDGDVIVDGVDLPHNVVLVAAADSGAADRFSVRLAEHLKGITRVHVSTIPFRARRSTV
jgi:hypothetical protein